MGFSMNAELHQELSGKIKSLKEITAQLSLQSLVNFVCSSQSDFNFKKSRDLTSPFRQGSYLLGLMMSQSEPDNPILLDEDLHKNICDLLNDIFNYYAFSYFFIDKKDEIKVRQTGVVMSAFIHYFFTGKNFNSSQIKDWILFWFDDFSADLSDRAGFSIEDILKFGGVMESSIKESFDIKKSDYEELDKIRRNFIEACENDISKFQEEIERIRSNSDYMERVSCFFNGLDGTYAIDKNIIINKLGFEVFDKLISVFGMQRGQGEEIFYITDRNPVSYKSIIMDGDFIYFLANNSFYESAITYLEEFFYKKHPNSQKNTQKRDKKLEVKVVEVFKKIITNEALFIESAFENKNSTNEHDLVIVDGKTILIVEAKASPPKEPMRDIEKAFPRIRDHFKSASGLQKAYEQAVFLRNRVFNEKKVDLYDRKGNFVYQISSDDIEDVFCICVTRDDFGALGCNLEYLLDKANDSDYPWVIDVANLECMIQGFIHLGKTNSDLYDYIKDRVKLHGKIISMDELEYAGAFLKYEGGLKGFVEAKADFIQLDIEESDIFDDIYFSSLEGEVYNLKKEKLDLQEFRISNFLKPNEIKIKSNEMKGNLKKTALRKNKQQKSARKNNRKK